MGSITLNKPKNILELPGEIRNRIYDAAVAGGNFSVTLVGPSREFIKWLNPKKCPPDWSSSDRPLLGITQTCRQFRAETLPIYYQHQKVSVTYFFLNSYSNTFVFQGKPDHPSPIHYCDVTVLENADWHMEGIFTAPAKDLVPLLRLHNKNPGFKLRFCEILGIDTIMSSLTDKDNAVWWKYMDKAVSRILY